MQTYAIVALVSYLLGSIPFGYILVRLFLKTDVRTLGSGNIGATNVGRTGHRGLAIATLLLDAGKGAGAVWLAGVANAWYHANLVAGHSDVVPLNHAHALQTLAALFAIAGHMFPVWLKFRGGKGVATAVGAFAVISPGAVGVVLLIFLLLVAVSRYVSLGSIVAAALFPIALFLTDSRWIAERKWILRGFTIDPYDYVAPPPRLAAIFVILAASLIVVRHHQNIRRLLSGTENKLGAKAPLPQNPIQTEKNA